MAPTLPAHSNIGDLLPTATCRKLGAEDDDETPICANSGPLATPATIPNYASAKFGATATKGVGGGGLESPEAIIGASATAIGWGGGPLPHSPCAENATALGEKAAGEEGLYWIPTI